MVGVLVAALLCAVPAGAAATDPGAVPSPPAAAEQPADPVAPDPADEPAASDEDVREIVVRGPTAAEPSPEEAEPSPEEIVVFGELEAARHRQQVMRDLRNLGYRAGKRKDGYTQFRPEVPWKPTVRVYDDGFVVLKRSPVRWQPPGDPRNKINNLWCLPPFTPMCLRVGGVLVSKRKLDPQKARVANALEPELRDWRAAVAATAMEERVGVELPDQLDALWQEGRPLDPRQPVVADMAARRAILLELWSSRTCTPEGAQVRGVVEVFLEYEVQTSPFAVTAEELAGAQARHRCGARLELPMPAGGDPAVP